MVFDALWPLALYFAAGALLRATGILRSDHAGIVFRTVFYVTLPALAFDVVSDATLDGRSLWLPVIGFSINALCVLAAVVAGKSGRMNRADIVTLVVGVGITNMLFSFPFILVLLGPEALADAVILDIGNALFVTIVVNHVAIRHGAGPDAKAWTGMRRFLTSPLFLALVLALIVNGYGLQVPEMMMTIIEPVGRITVPLTILALGLSFHVQGLRGKLPWIMVAIRMGFGLLLGLAIVAIVGFDARTATIVIASAAAPIGFMAATFASVAKLDAAKVSAAISMSVLIGLVTTPAILILLPHLL
ncbi:MAG: AEC family transporter [Woeseiaceae bacterium]